MDTSALSSNDWQLVCKLFDELASCPPAERSMETLEHSQAVIETLKQMLAAHDSSDLQLLDNTIQSIAGRMGALPAETDIVDYRQQRFGPWRAIEEVGRGGMAVVLRGERADGQFEKEVAIKLLPTGDAESERERLLEEIRILARLEHPNIAHLIDGGISKSGIPYLVMEYVRGQPITEYCNQQGLDVGQRVRLLTQVIEAVSHAHRHLVVHCDLKPGNILVSEDGRVKLVDFGIASLISKRTGRASAPRELICSPGHAAPEQLRGAPPAISQDVFSLGAVLYLLLCDRPIRDNQIASRLLFSGRASGEAITPPSQHARNRRIDQDLDAICSRALAPDPAHRYASTSEMHADLQAWLACRPVSARVGGVHYRSAKWLRRHWLPASALCAILLAVVTGAAVALWQAQQAREQASAALVESARAQATRDFLVELFSANDPNVALGRMPTARDLLDQGVERMQSAFVDTPWLRAEMLVMLGDLYRRIGEHEASRPLLEQGWQMAEKHDAPELQVRALISLGALEQATGNLDASLNRLNDAEARLEAIDKVPSKMHAGVLQDLTLTLTNMGFVDEAVDRASRALAIARSHPGLAPTTMFDYLMSKANALLVAERYREAEPLLIEAQAIDHGPHPGARISLHSQMGAVLQRRGDHAGAIEHRRQATALANQVYVRHHPHRARLLNNLASALLDGGYYQDALSALNQALEIYQSIYPDGRHPSVAAAHHNLGRALKSVERYAEAEPHVRNARELAGEFFGIEDVRYAMATENLGDLLGRMGRHIEAEQLLIEAMASKRKVLGNRHQAVGASKIVMARLRLDQDQADEALELARSALVLFDEINHDSPRHLISAHMYRARALAALGQTRDAHLAYARALELGETAGPDAGSVWPQLLAYHAQFLVQQANPEAPIAMARALDEHRSILGELHPATQRMERLVAQSGLETH